MQDLKVTLVQADQRWEAKQENLDHFNELLETTVDVDLIVLPEMFNTAFTMHASEMAESMDTSPAIEWLRQLAFTKNAAVYTSLIIQDAGKNFNRGLFVEPDGKLTIYDKRKLFGLAGEDNVFDPGVNETIVHYKGWNIQLQICYDLRFPELIRNRIEPNQSPAYDVLVYVANWPQRRNVHWKVLLQARAIENQCYVVGVNRVGTDGTGLSYSGDSMFINPLGEHVDCEEGKEQVLTVELSFEQLKTIREQLPFLKDR